MNIELKSLFRVSEVTVDWFYVLFVVRFDKNSHVKRSASKGLFLALVRSTPNIESRPRSYSLGILEPCKLFFFKGRRKKCINYNTNDAVLLFTIGYTKLFLGQERKDKKSSLKCELYSVQMRFSYNSANVLSWLPRKLICKLDVGAMIDRSEGNGLDWVECVLSIKSKRLLKDKETLRINDVPQSRRKNTRNIKIHHRSIIS